MEGEAQFYRQRYMERNQRRRRGPMSSASSARSFIGALSPDAISPDMAADAHDPGTLNNGYTNGYFSGSTTGGGGGDDDCLNCCSPVGNLLDYSDLDFETRRILTLTFPATIESAMDPLFRLGVVVLISNFLNTNSMVAFVIVSLLLRTSAEEVTGALVDAQSSLLQEAIAEGGNMGFLLSGQAVQLGIHIQFLIMVPLLGIWAIFMEDVVSWLVPENPEIAQVSADYAQIILLEFYIKALSRSFMLLFHLTGQAQFELNVDLTMYAVTIAVIAIASSVVSGGISLEGIAWIQVMVSAISALGKMAYILRKGLVKPYQQGLLGSFALLELQKVRLYFNALFPLLLGSLIEVGEWQVLMLFVQHLGGAEVATWAMMGILWEICEAFTEGLGEGAAVRVSYYLTENLPNLAKQLANKAVFLSIVESTILTAIILMIGPNLSVALTQDAVLQNLFNDLVPMIALANLSMSLAQIYWSLVGAQGYFSRASAVILAIRWLAMIPLACALIYSNTFDLLSVVVCISMGYAIGGMLLARMIFQSDWTAVAADHRDDAGEMDGVQMELDEVGGEEEESESEDDSSTGFGM
jgi:Na+-driven multidrug efflux pump